MATLHPYGIAKETEYVTIEKIDSVIRSIPTNPVFDDLIKQNLEDKSLYAGIGKQILIDQVTKEIILLKKEYMSNQVMSGRQMDIEEFKHRIKKIFENVAIDNFSRDTIIKKINKLLDILIKLPEYDDDYKIVTQMKEEYTNDKKIYSSTLMYLNKLYKQTKQKE